MGVLNREQIIQQLELGELLINARKDANGNFEVEPASYDLAAGIAVIKHDGLKIFSRRAKQYKFIPNTLQRDTVTLKPGQMMFVITNEEIKMPIGFCGTVYSRNSLAQKGVLALNAGHIDPGFRGPITIKLINLRNINFTLKLGDPIFTIVFTKLEAPLNGLKGQTITLDDTLNRVLAATDLSLDNALYDLALLNNFVKRSEFGKEYFKWLRTSFWGIFTFLLTIIGAFVTIAKVLELLGLSDLLKSIIGHKQ